MSSKDEKGEKGGPKPMGPKMQCDLSEDMLQDPKKIAQANQGEKIWLRRERTALGRQKNVQAFLSQELHFDLARTKSKLHCCH